ncbi:MAG: methylmalonyl Co-A mutase-associated GTPase MeaB [Anaerolineae bacterium]
MDQLAEEVLSGKRRSIARAISLVEDRQPGYQALLSTLYPHTGHAYRIGVTGPPGTGKSTLIAQLARSYREKEHRVAIVGVDPSSPYSGGALLGDRIRMRALAGDSGVLIRSMATRGELGGLAWATSEVVQILDAAGYSVILIETVGAGQGDVEIARAVHTTLLVQAPGLGDEIQAIKAGTIEIADIFVVNKSDRAGADQVVRVLQSMLALAETPWIPPICETVALDGTGVAELMAAVASHRAYLALGPGRERERAWSQHELERLIQRELLAQFLDSLPADKLSELVARIAARDLSPYQALEELGLQDTIGS